MTLQQMEYIVALDKYRHFVLAAEACGVTQPTLSAMIQKLEEELDVKIFNRDRKNITPTRIGEKIIRQAQIVLNETQCIKVHNDLLSESTFVREEGYRWRYSFWPGRMLQKSRPRTSRYRPESLTGRSSPPAGWSG